MNQKITLLAIIALLAVVTAAFAVPYYQDWKSKPENRDPYHISGTVYDMNISPLEGVNVTVSGQEGKLSAATTTDSGGKYGLDIPACIRNEDQYQPISTEQINQGPVDSISQAAVTRVWMCGNPWKISVNMEKDGYSPMEKNTFIGKEHPDKTIDAFTSKKGSNKTSSEMKSEIDNGSQPTMPDTKKVLAAHNFEQWSEQDKKDLTEMMSITTAGGTINPEGKSKRVLETYIDLLEAAGYK